MYFNFMVLNSYGMVNPTPNTVPGEDTGPVGPGYNEIFLPGPAECAKRSAAQPGTAC